MISYYLRNKIIEHLLRSSTWTRHVDGGVSVALFHTDPTPAHLGGTEVDKLGYARQPLNYDDINWTSPTTGYTENLVTVTFGPISQAQGWQDIIGVGLIEGQSLFTGELLLYSTLPNPVPAAFGDPNILFPPGTLRWTVD